MPEEKFEDKLRRLEQIVEKLEGGEITSSEDISLEDSLEMFEEGVRISKECAAILGKVKKRIQKLTKDEDGAFKLEELDD